MANRDSRSDCSRLHIGFYGKPAQNWGDFPQFQHWFHHNDCKWVDRHGEHLTLHAVLLVDDDALLAELLHAEES